MNRKSSLSDLMTKQPRIINVGIAEFFESLRNQGVDVAQVDWQPPARGKPELIQLLRKLREGKQ